MRLRQPKKDTEFFRKKAHALLDEVAESNLGITEILALLFGISHLFLDFGQSVLAHSVEDVEPDEAT